MEERDDFTRLLKLGFVDSFRQLHPKTVQYTYWSMRSGCRQRNIGWRLDYFVISKDAADRAVAVDTKQDVLGSDHCPVILTLKC